MLKQILSILLCLCLLAAFAAVGSAADSLSAADSTAGDLNSDGQVNIIDALRLFRFVNGQFAGTIDSMPKADYTEDNNVNIADALRLFRYINGQIDILFGPQATPSPTQGATATPEPTSVPSDSGSVSRLHVDGTHLADAGGNTVQLRGVSTHGLAWFPQYVNADCFRQLHDDWGANVIRLALYTAENGGYCTGGNQSELKSLIECGVQYAVDAGMYVIIDWHVLNDCDPNVYKSQAIEFFREMSALYADCPNVIYEICNEPNGSADWAGVKSYAMDVISVIRANSPDSVILVGTPNWSQYLDQAAADPITGYDNIMYTLHFYAATHKDDLRRTYENAIAAGLPVFVSEFGICDASGNGSIDTTSANTWIAALNAHGTSYVMWSLCNKDEAASILKSSCSKISGFQTDNLSASGKWILGILSGSTQLPEYTSEETAGTAQPSAQPTAAAVSAVTGTEENGLSYTVNPVNSWLENGVDVRQYSMTVTNDSGSAFASWTVTLDFDADVTLVQGWNGNYTASGSTLTVTAADYNASIEPGAGAADVGFIVRGATVIG